MIGMWEVRERSSVFFLLLYDHLACSGLDNGRGQSFIKISPTLSPSIYSQLQVIELVSKGIISCEIHFKTTLEPFYTCFTFDIR